ncbi:MAG TPA: hypothetical protein VFG30_12680 [Polyangiales bacterium]|nr:hypothetical protein [Polyangiales bacterium]
MSAESGHSPETTIGQSHIESLRGRDDLALVAGLSARVETLEGQLREQSKSLKITPRMLTVIGSVIAAVIPLTTAIDGYLKWRADLAVTAQQQLHAARMDSLKTVLSAQLPELERESRLRLLLAMLEPQDAIHASPEALEYQQAKRMSDAATTKVNARARRLLGSDLL